MNDFPKTEKEIMETIGVETIDGESKIEGASENGEDKKVTRLTDTSNAELMRDMFGDSIRFDHRRKRWLVWKKHRWKPDNDGTVSRLAIKSARKRYREAVGVGDYSERGRVSKWAIQSENRPKIEAAMGLAKVLLPIADTGDGWDTNNFLLSCPNGIVDLKTGKLRNGKPEDRITMSTNTEYKPAAKCPRWELFIDEIFEEDKEIVKYVHKALGYSITGDTSEQVAFFCYGAGANGKSVMFKAVREVLGDYAHDAPASLLQKSYNASSTNDEAATENKRFLVSSEALSASKLNESRLKKYTGGDPITARYLYKEFITFPPTVKPWLFINHKPRVDDDSLGFWRRVRLIPFNRKFIGEDDDKLLPDKLKKEAEGILAWLVRGCLLWQEEGLEPAPEVVNEATKTYQAESDVLYDFLADTYGDKVEKEVRAKDFYKEYTRWSEDQGLKQKDILNHIDFSKRMADKFKKDRDSKGHYYKNVGPTTPFEPECTTKPPFPNTPHMRESIDSLKKTPQSPTPVPKTAKSPTRLKDKIEAKEEKAQKETKSEKPEKKDKKLYRLTLSQLNKKKDFTEKWLKENEGNSKYPAVLKHYQEILDAISLKK